MIRATRGRSRRPNHMHSHLDALQAMAPIDFRRGPSGFHSVAKRTSFYIAFGRDFCGFRIDFGRFWGGKMEGKIDFLEVFVRCFFGLRFGIDLRIFGGAKPETSITTIGFSMVFAHLQKINVFEKSMKKPRFLNRFWRSKPWKIEKQRCWKPCVFLTSIFHRFFSIFWFWLDFGRPRRLKKSIKNRKNRVGDGFGTRLGSSIDFGHDLGAILIDFGWTLAKFLELLGRMSNDDKHCRLQNLLWWLGRRGADQ